MTKPFSISLFPVIPAWQISLLAVGLLAFLAYGCALLARKNVPRRWIVTLGVLRVAIVAVFTVSLLQPVVSYSRSEPRRPEMVVLVDTSASMGLPRAEGTGSRLDEALGALRGQPLLTHLREQFQLRWFAFDRQAYPLGGLEEGELKPVGEDTHLADSLTSALDYRRLAAAADPSASAAPEHVLLVSDGNDLGSADVVETARRAGMAVDTLAPVVVASPASGPDVVLADVQTSRRVLLGAETRFLVTLRNELHSAEPCKLVLSEDGKDVETHDVSLPKDRDELQVPIAHRPVEAGLKRYEVRVVGNRKTPHPVPSRRDGIPGRGGNDAAPLGKPYAVNVQVVSDKHELLILQDTWRWDFKFLRRILEDDPNFSLTALLTRGGNAFVQFGEPDRRVNLAGFPQGRDELDWFDTIVLADVNPGRWPRGLASTIARAVVDDGKSLVVIAGPNLGLLADVPELEMLLPVEITRAAGTPVEGPIDVNISLEGTRSPFFFQTPSSGKAGSTASLPPLDQIYPVVRKGPAATVLLEAARHTNGDGNLIVMAEHTVGRGRVLFIGTDTLWKWQTLGPQNEAGATLYQVFWQQALRALAPPRAESSAVNLWLQAERSRYEAGRIIHLRAEIDAERPLVQPRIQATVLLPSGRQAPLSFTPDPVTPHAFVAEFESSASGPYRIAAAVRSEGKALAEGSTAVEVAPAKTELDATPVNAANMARIAAGTGGRVVVPSDPKTWPDSSSREPVFVSVARTLDLWHNFTLLLVLCGLLGADWLMRLVRGYV